MNGIRAMCIVISAFGAVNRQPRDCRRSAAPDEDVEARLPC